MWIRQDRAVQDPDVQPCVLREQAVQPAKPQQPEVEQAVRAIGVERGRPSRGGVHHATMRHAAKKFGVAVGISTFNTKGSRAEAKLHVPVACMPSALFLKYLELETCFQFRARGLA